MRKTEPKRRSVLISPSGAERENRAPDVGHPLLPNRDELERQRHITLSQKHISDGYVASLIDVLKDRQSAVTLTLHKCQISHEALELIVKALPDMHHLTGLEIVRPRCKPCWLLALEQGLPDNTSLTLLNVVVSKTAIKHANALARGLKCNRSLEQVRIRLDCRTQVLIVLKHLLGTAPSENASATSHGAGPEFPVPLLRNLSLRANKKGTGYGGEMFGKKACRLLIRLIDERTLLGDVELVPGLSVSNSNKKMLVDLGRAADRQMVDLSIHMEPYAVPPLNVSELRRRQYLFASPAALRAATRSVHFKATHDGIPLPADLMGVIASHLPSSGPQRAAWLLRGLLSVTKTARAAADSARSRAHAQRLLRHLQCEPETTAKGISNRKKKASAEALADIWRLGLAGFPLQPHDQMLVIKATKKNPVWLQCRSLVEERVMRLSRQHREIERMLEKRGSPQLARAEELGRRLNGPGFPITAMHGLL